jgi:hypothetical protein
VYRLVPSHPQQLCKPTRILAVRLRVLISAQIAAPPCVVEKMMLYEAPRNSVKAMLVGYDLMCNGGTIVDIGDVTIGTTAAKTFNVTNRR